MNPGMMLMFTGVPDFENMFAILGILMIVAYFFSHLTKEDSFFKKEYLYLLILVLTSSGCVLWLKKAMIDGASDFSAKFFLVSVVIALVFCVVAFVKILSIMREEKKNENELFKCFNDSVKIRRKSSISWMNVGIIFMFVGISGNSISFLLLGTSVAVTFLLSLIIKRGLLIKKEFLYLLTYIYWNLACIAWLVKIVRNGDYNALSIFLLILIAVSLIFSPIGIRKFVGMIRNGKKEE